MSVLEIITLILTTIFLITVLSYYILLLIPKRKGVFEKSFKSISIIIPAHNEQDYIKDAIESVIKADFKGSKEIIVVDDGSIDKTSEIIKPFKKKGIIILKTKHLGKSAALNLGISKAKGELIAVVDGDSIIHKDALIEVSKEVEKKGVAAACCPVRVKNRKKFICMWLHIGEIYFSLMRGFFSRIDANITTPGPLSVYRRKELLSIGGFNTQCFSEDADVAIRLIRKGYKIGFANNAIAETNMPYKFKDFFRQRLRFARGLIKLLKTHLTLNKTAIDLYTLPLFLFGYVQAVIMGGITIYNIISGYITYFSSKGVYLNIWVLKFFFEWLSIVGFIKWTISTLTGQSPLTIVAAVGIISTFLTYPLYAMAIIRFDKKLDLWHIIPFIFMFPFWIIIMCIQIIALPEIFYNKQPNIWKKNE